MWYIGERSELFPYKLARKLLFWKIWHGNCVFRGIKKVNSGQKTALVPEIVASDNFCQAPYLCGAAIYIH